jgi:hypothetical protein
MTSRETMEMVNDCRTLMMTSKDTEGGMMGRVRGIHNRRSTWYKSWEWRTQVNELNSKWEFEYTVKTVQTPKGGKLRRSGVDMEVLGLGLSLCAMPLLEFGSRRCGVIQSCRR